MGLNKKNRPQQKTYQFTKERKLIYIALVFGFFGFAAYAQGSVSDYVQNVFFNNSGANNITTNIFVNNNQTTITQNYTVNQTGLMNLSGNTTNDLSEGSNNLYYTNARVLTLGNNTYMALGNVSSCDVSTQKYSWNSSNQSWDCSVDVGGSGGNASYPLFVGNATGVLPNASIPASAMNYSSPVGLAIVRNSSDSDVIASAVTTKVKWNTEDKDGNNEFANDNYTAPVTGTYQITGKIYFTGTIVANKAYIVKVYKNEALSYDNVCHTSLVDDLTCGFDGAISLNASDIVNIYVRSVDGVGAFKVSLLSRWSIYSIRKI